MRHHPNRCSICDMPIEDSQTRLQKIIGWEQKRQKGGANQIKMREPQAEWAHNVCVERALRGDPRGQLTLG